MIVSDTNPSAGNVAAHYDGLDTAYRRIWGEHVHHGYWQTGRESAAEAADALVGLVARRLDLLPGHRVCDIGCGYGATAAEFAKRHGVEVTGLTLSAAQWEVAEARRAPGFTCLKRDWLENGLPGECFDRAYAIESSEHMADKARFFTEAWRVLRPGGRLVVCAWLEGESVRPWEVRHLLKKICSEGQLPSLGSRTDYEALAAEAGFECRSYDDISRNVRKTWSICMRRLAASLVTDGAIRRLAFETTKENFSFVYSLPRLALALKTGAMRYGVFVWEKPGIAVERPGAGS